MAQALLHGTVKLTVLSFVSHQKSHAWSLRINYVGRYVVVVVHCTVYGPRPADKTASLGHLV